MLGVTVDHRVFRPFQLKEVDKVEAPFSVKMRYLVRPLPSAAGGDRGLVAGEGGLDVGDVTSTVEATYDAHPPRRSPCHHWLIPC